MNCGEGLRPLSQVAEPRWILLANIFSALGVPIGAESVMAGRCVVKNTEPGSQPGLFVYMKYFSDFYTS